jgi:hypothetical protein
MDSKYVKVSFKLICPNKWRATRNLIGQVSSIRTLSNLVLRIICILEENFIGIQPYNQFPTIRDDYRDYVDLCIKEFGDRVTHWITFNEPNYFASGGYATGTQAPGRCSNYIGNCTFGNSGTEPYIVGHNILLSHATAVKLYREKYQVRASNITFR